jgi:hypothetical protein
MMYQASLCWSEVWLIETLLLKIPAHGGRISQNPNMLILSIS